MGALRRWTSRAAAILRGRAADRELDAEFESHLQLHIEDNVRAGMMCDCLSAGGDSGRVNSHAM